jgi:Flp pilus assembly pilin Flp
MMAIRKKIKRLLCDESGATAVEYCLIAGAMTVMLVPSMAYLSTSVRENLYDVIIGLFY